jgi:hypothetical protein
VSYKELNEFLFKTSFDAIKDAGHTPALLYLRGASLIFEGKPGRSGETIRTVIALRSADPTKQEDFCKVVSAMFAAFHEHAPPSFKPMSAVPQHSDPSLLSAAPEALQTAPAAELYASAPQAAQQAAHFHAMHPQQQLQQQQFGQQVFLNPLQFQQQQGILLAQQQYQQHQAFLAQQQFQQQQALLAQQQQMQQGFLQVQQFSQQQAPMSPEEVAQQMAAFFGQPPPSQQ